MRKAAGADDDKTDPVTAADDADYDALGHSVRPETRRVAADAAEQGLHQVVTDPVDAMLSQANKRAHAWADSHAAELVTQIRDTTRDRVRELVKQALEEGWSNDDLADALEADGVFSDARAETIARTETAYADVAGNLIGWQESGVVQGKEWILAQDQYCDDCADMDGQIVALDEDFPEGDPPLHPNCRCDVLPVMMEEDDEE